MLRGTAWRSIKAACHYSVRLQNVHLIQLTVIDEGEKIK